MQNLISLARKKNLAEYLIASGHSLKKEGNQYRVTDFKGLIVKDNMWYNHLLCTGGNTLDYLVKMEGHCLVTAVKTLAGLELYDKSNTIIDLPKRNTLISPI